LVAPDRTADLFKKEGTKDSSSFGDNLMRLFPWQADGKQ
jgi:hypothetical protein